MTSEAELLANLPADGVRVFRGNPGVLRCSNSMYTWMSSESGWKEAHYVSPEFYATDARWTEITPPPVIPALSLRDQRIAEAWERWPEGRMFEDVSEPNQLELRMCVNGVARFTARHKQEWHAEENDPTYVYESANHWHEIPRPAVVPALPDPSGDLPDGTRVRVTLEGVTQRWLEGGGTVQYGTNEYRACHRKSLIDAGATIEVLSLPTPPPSALQGEPGSLWRDPETGTIWCRTYIVGVNRDFTQASGPRGEWLHLSKDVDHATVARLVPAEVADHG